MDQATSDKQQAAVFSNWVAKLTASGKSADEIRQLLLGVARLSALDLYTAIMLSLTEADLKLINEMGDTPAAQDKMAQLFKERTGMTVDEVARNTQAAFAKGYLAAEDKAAS